MKEFFRSIKTNIMCSAVLCILLGIVLVIYPGASLAVVTRAVGIIVLITGIGFLVSHFNGGILSRFLKLDLILGVLFTILGGYILLNPAGLIAIIPIVFGILLIYHGMIDMQQSFELHKYEDEQWWISFLIALATLVLGIVVMMNPFASMDTLMRVIGICLIYDGISDLLIVGKVSRTVRNFKKEIEPIEGEFKEL